MDSFNSAADITLRDVLGTISFQSWPPILCFQVHVHLSAARMDRKNRIMCLLENLVSQTRVVRNKHPVFKEKRALIINMEGLILRKLQVGDDLSCVRIAKLTGANLFFQERGCQKIQKIPLFHNFKVELTEFLAQERLLFLHQEVVNISFAAESICHNISFNRSVVDGQIKIIDCFNPPPLPKVEIRLSEDILQTLVIGKDFTTVAQQVMPPYFQRKDNCCEFEVMSRIVDLMRLQLTRGISNNLFLLHKDRTQSLQRGVTEYLERLRGIRRNQDWSGGELLFECLKACLTCRSPKIFLAFLEEIGKRLRYLGKVLNKATAITSQTKEAPHFFDINRRKPFNNGLHSFRANCNALGRDDVTQIGSLRQPNLTLGELCIEAVLTKLV